MKAGDLVIRKISGVPAGAGLKSAVNQRDLLGYGLVLSNVIAGRPPHPCVSVYYPKAGKIYDIAESLLEVISEAR
jgi:hypothetical protein